MAVAATYSTEATNHKSVENTKNATTCTEGAVKISSATVAVAAADDNDSLYFVLPLRSSWSVKHIWTYCDAITSGSDWNVGLYTTAATPVVVSENCYADAQDLSTAITKLPVDLAYQARNITAVNNRVYQDGGVTTEPNVWYWLTFKGVAVGSAAGDITVVVHYTE
jgi:hypothetical protein